MHRKRMLGLTAAAILLAGCGNAPPPAPAEPVRNLSDSTYRGFGRPGHETWRFGTEPNKPANRGPASRAATGWLSRFGVPESGRADALVLSEQDSIRVTPAKPWAEDAAGTVSTAVRWFDRDRTDRRGT
ncbi:hypothetical protein [Amycolatopsis sp. NPDC059657]|uniref:hypothetical protein n=1 Tax=Amycolatopsis sp. NPDC059657 TaxID=3346899 RepID=UPI00366EF5C1